MEFGLNRKPLVCWLGC